MARLPAEAEARARAAVRRCARATPLVKDEDLSRLQGRPVWLKPEQLQPGGSYKLRPAAASLALLSPEEREKGVVASSGGNFAISLALAAQKEGVSVTLVLPPESLAEKRSMLEGLGATLLVGDRPGYDAAEEKAKEIARRSGKTFLSPTEGEAVYLGNRTIAEEIFLECPEISWLCAAVGGGGLCIGLALEARERGACVLGTSPEAASAMARSLQEGAARLSDEGGETWAEPLLGGVPEENFLRARDLLFGVEIVPEESLLVAMRALHERHGFLVEAAGAVPYALASSKKLPGEGPVALILSGGNLSPERRALLGYEE